MNDAPFDLRPAELSELCRRYGVRRLDLFGSAATGAFDPARSDIDFLVDFDEEPAGLFDRYFALKESLEALYGRPVDLVTAGSLRNPHFIAAVNETRRLVYALEDAQAASWSTVAEKIPVLLTPIESLLGAQT
jgi:predicted nucleotidyltransferase